MAFVVTLLRHPYNCGDSSRSEGTGGRNDGLPRVEREEQKPKYSIPLVPTLQGISVSRALFRCKQITFPCINICTALCIYFLASILSLVLVYTREAIAPDLLCDLGPVSDPSEPQSLQTKTGLTSVHKFFLPLR